MVLKKGKGGVCSGNTLRLKSCKYIQQYKRDAFITMMNDNCEDSNSSTKYLDSSNISYSINKKGRWNLPQVIKDELATNLRQSDCKVSLVEFQNIRRVNNCVGYFTNKGRINKLVPKKTKFMNGRSVVYVNNTIKKHKSKRDDRRLKGDNQNSVVLPVADDKENSVCYEVVYPADTKSSNVYSKPIIAKNKSNARTWVSCSSVSNSKNNKSKKRTVPLPVGLCADDYFFSEDEDNDEVYQENIQGEDKLKEKYVLSEYFNQAFTKETLPCPRKRRHNRSAKQNSSITQKLFYEDNSLFNQNLSDTESDDGFVYVENAASTTNKAKLIPVSVVLPKQDVSDEYLEIRFPGRVHRAKCHPRKFCIDIKEDVKEILKHSPVFKKTVIQKLDLSSYLVFSYIRSFDDLYDVYNLSVNIPTKQNIIKLETIFDMMLTDIDDVLNRSLMFIESFLQPETFIQKEQLYLRITNTVKFKTIFTSTQSEELSSEDESFEWISKEKDQFCNICYENLEENSSTALQECGHWFCNICYKEYLESSFNKGLLQNITCPEYNCSKVVDHATMISLTNIRDVEKMKIRVFESSTAASSMKWCPNQLCGRMLQPLNKVSNISICQCGTNVCTNCHKEGHWPASCEQYAFYRKKLDAFKDDVFVNAYWIPNDVNLKGKNCPKCKQFIVKNGGCPYMSCVCGEYFCWSCLSPQSSHRKDRSWCYNRLPTEGTRTQTVKYLPRIDSPEDRTEFYLHALECREARHTKHIKILRKQTNDLQSQMLWWVSKKNKTGVCVPITQNMVRYLFIDLVDLIVELNFAAEFCFVMMDYKQGKQTAASQAVSYIAHSLKCRIGEIQAILKNSLSENRQNTFSALQHGKDLGKTLLESLVKVMSKV